MSLSTHVLDSTRGRPAAAMSIRLESPDGSTVKAVTDDDGRVRDFGDLIAGTHRLVFDTGAYFTGLGVDAFYPEVVVAFEITEPEQHHHVPLLLSPFAYSTYRGS
ncbi:5-hydroxyisourate hydrolase [Herbihabitans rhizosphaerae]|uniref:5-hydroxyisourate hydrolase n=1 Tax=Herbihabitans rhizosphaerae TaxID=1872711 RepID=A0A4Q7KLE6_9PSEU|nr:hydroxyisourate hydrolase [Herbihabitans rhizosphaerae]RZS36351.1 5-hydroxyisourate hydrolase [Herbihabitans rhizosphaerae]